MNWLRAHAHLVPGLVFVLGLAIAPDVAGAYTITLMNYIGLYTIVAVGLVMLTGVAGLTSFGQAAFVGIGAYTTAYLTTAYAVSPWFGLVAGMACTMAIAWVLGLLTLRLSGHYLPLGTIAWGISLYYLFGNLGFLGGQSGMGGIPPIVLFGAELTSGQACYYLIWLVALASLFASRNILDSRPGRAVRALKGGGLMAESCGVDTAHYRIVVFVYAAMLAGVSGWLYAHLQRFVNPTPFSIGEGIEYLFMAVVGGSSSVWGAVVGAGVIYWLRDVLQDWLPKILGATGNFEIIVFGILIILLLQFAREGLWFYGARAFARCFPFISAGKSRKLDRSHLPPRARLDSGETLLKINAATKRFGGLLAVNSLSLSMQRGEILGLIGPNGAGKSTLFNLISGALPLSSGHIEFLGQRINGLPPYAISRLGLARTFQHVKLIPGMTALENAALGAHSRGKGGLLRAALRFDRAEEAQLLGEGARNLERVGLQGHSEIAAANLPLGNQRLVEIARALAGDPILLLLDEPAAGLRYKEKQALAQLLRDLRAEGVSVLLVEHDMEFVMGLADRLVVLDFGELLAEGAPAEIQKHPAVLEAYLGGVA
jgi:ABC-type branched-subunit amino acid transport system ATPase component/ABC-type branched-subunit amino acid transport system permease subunit